MSWMYLPEFSCVSVCVGVCQCVSVCVQLAGPVLSCDRKGWLFQRMEDTHELLTPLLVGGCSPFFPSFRLLLFFLFCNSFVPFLFYFIRPSLWFSTRRRFLLHPLLFLRVCLSSISASHSVVLSLLVHKTGETMCAVSLKPLPPPVSVAANVIWVRFRGLEVYPYLKLASVWVGRGGGGAACLYADIWTETFCSQTVLSGIDTLKERFELYIILSCTSDASPPVGLRWFEM